MIVEYRLTEHQLATVLFVDHLIMYALKEEVVIRYTKAGRSGQITLETPNIEYMEVKPD